MAIKQLPPEGWPKGAAGSAPEPAADSAGFPWEGRTFDHHGTAFADDNGETPQGILDAVATVREAVTDLASATDARQQRARLITLANAHASMVQVCTGERFLIPLIAEAGSHGLTPEGKTVEKSQELSIVTVQSPDGRGAMPIFTSVALMQAWNPLARPIPVPGAQVAVAAAQEETDIVVIDPGSAETEYAIRRPALEAFALGQKLVPSWADPEVVRAFDLSVEHEPHVVRVLLAPGDPEGRLKSAETVVGLVLKPGLDQSELHELTSRLNGVWSQDEVIARKVDSLEVQLRRAEES